MQKKIKAKNYVVTYSVSDNQKDILVMLRAIGKYLYENSDKLIKTKHQYKTWKWKSNK